MKQFRYKTTFASTVRCLMDEEKDKILAKASLDNLKSIIPESVKNQPTLLAIAFNSCVANYCNLNGAVIDTKTALAIYKDFIHLPINSEHSREASYGHIVNASFSEFDINYATGSGSKILDTASLKDTNEPFNLSLAGVIYKLYAPKLCEAIEESNDPNSGKYLDISASWELLYDEFDLAVGSRHLKDCDIISDEDKKEEYAKYLLANDGSGKLPDGRPVFILLKNEVVAGGIGLTLNPAGHVKGVVTDSEQVKIETKSSQNDSNMGNKKETIIGKGCEKCKKNENSNSQSNLSNVNPNNNIKNNIKIMLKTRKDITDENLKEANASQVLTVLDTEIDKINEEWKGKKNEVDVKLSEAEKKSTELEKSIQETNDKLAKASEDLQKLVKANEDREKEEIFNTRMTYFDGEYDLSEEKIRNIVARKIKVAVTDEAYNEAKEEIELLLAAKKKSGKVFDKKTMKWVDPKEVKEEEEEEDAEGKKKKEKAAIASVEDKTEKSTVVEDAIDNGDKTKAAIAATIAPTETQTDKWTKAFGEDGWEVEKRAFRRK